MRAVLAAASFAAQIAAIVHSRGGAGRYFCWAPNDVTAEYTLSASIAGRPLDPETIRARYQRPWFEEIAGLSDPYPQACGWVRCGAPPPDAAPRRPYDLVEFRSHQHVIDVIQQYEATYGSDAPAEVTMRFRINGGPEQMWTGP